MKSNKKSSKASAKKQPKSITIRGVKISIVNFCIMASTLLMTTSILVFGIILLSRESANAETKNTNSTPTNGNAIITGTNNEQSSGETEETVTVETGEPVEETTEEVETLEFDADEGGSSTGSSPLRVKVSTVNTWEAKNDTILVQYRVKIKNRTKETIENWGLSFHFEGNFTLMDNWNALVEKDEDNIKITPVSKNQIIEPDVEYELGFIVKTDGYNYPKAYTVVLDDFSKTVNLTFTIPEETTEPTTEDKTTEASTEEKTTVDSESQTTTKEEETTESTFDEETTTGDEESTTKTSDETATSESNGEDPEVTTTERSTEADATVEQLTTAA